MPEVLTSRAPRAAPGLLSATERERLLSSECALARISHALVSDLKLEGIADVVLEQSIAILDADMAVLHLADAERRELHLFAQRQAPRLREGLAPEVAASLRCLPYAAALPTAAAARTARVQVAPATAGLSSELGALDRPDAALSALAQLGVWSVLAVPLRSREHLLGVLTCLLQSARSISPAEVQFHVIAADLFAVAVENVRLHQELRDREQHVSLLLKSTIDAQEEERERICLELHDGVAQTLAPAFHYLQTLDSQPELPAALRSHIRKAAMLVRDAIREAREVIATLRPAALDTVGLVATLRYEIEDLRTQAGLEASFEADPVRLPKAVETALYRIAHEAINNVIKHARASRVTVRMQQRNGRIVVEVQDDGVGFDHLSLERQLRPKGVGLLSMRKRAELLQGTFSITAQSGHGTLVRVEVPGLAHSEQSARPAEQRGRGGAPAAGAAPALSLE